MYWDLLLFTSGGLGLVAAVLFAGKAMLRRFAAGARLREGFLNTWLLGTSIFVGLCLCEGIVRLSFSDVTTTADNMSYFARRWSAENVVRNSLGFREREVTTSSPPGVYRLAVIGDSFTFGQGVHEADRFTNIVDRRLNAIGRQFEVLNFGEGGAETIDHVRILEQVVLPLHPEFVLLQWFTNDVEGHDKNGRPPTSHLIPVNRISDLVQKVSAAYFMLNLGWNDLLKRIGSGPPYTYEEYLQRRFADPDSRDSQEANAALERFIAICREHRVLVGIVLFPRPDDNLTRDDAPLAFLFERVLDLCRKTATPCLDLRPKWAQVQPFERLQVGRFDAHPGALANQLAADAIVDRFAENWRVLREYRYPGVAASH